MPATKKPKYSYLTPLRIPAAKVGDWEIVVKHEPPGTKFDTANMRCRMFGKQPAIRITYEMETRWHYLMEGRGVWMSDIPCEHAQMLAALKGMRGRCLVGGLGLGLAATLLARSKAVSDIIVVEKQPEVIALVAKYLPSRVTVVDADLFDYLERQAKIGKPTFDNAFYDIWCSDGEATFFETVCPLIKASEGVCKRQPRNWNEDVMRGQLQHSCTSTLMMLAFEAQHPPEPGKPTRYPPWELMGSIWHDWKQPLFALLHSRGLLATPQDDDPARNSHIAAYCQLYGTWGWEDCWRAYAWK